MIYKEEDLRDVSQDIKIIARRSDGIGSRIIAIMHAFFLAHKLKINKQENVKIYWHKLLSSDSKGNLKKLDTNGNIQVLGIAQEAREMIFSPSFIEKYFIQKLPEIKRLDLHTKSYASFQDLYHDITINNIKTIESPLIDFKRIIKIENIDIEYKNQMSSIFSKIEFAQNIQQIIEIAKTKALEFGDFICIHIRSGDIIFDFSNLRKFNRQCIFHATPCELALGIIEKHPNKNIILVGDDLESIKEIAKIANRNDVFALTSIHSENMSNTESLFFDVAFLSQASCLYGTNSAVVRLANYIGNQKFVNSYSIFDDEQWYLILKKYFDVLQVCQYQKAFSLFHLFLVSKKLSKPFEEIISYLEMALELDYENDKYRIWKINCLLENGLISEAEKYLREILNIRANELIETILLRSWTGIVYGEVFKNYCRFIGYETPHLSFIASKIYEFQRNFQESLKCAKLAYEAEPKNEIFKDHLLKLLLEQPTPQPKVTTKEVIKEKLIIQEKPIPSIYLVAKDRIHNHLAYKLGSAMILNSKSLWGYMRMPYVLSYIKESHKKEQKEYEAKVKKNPSLKLPPIESYADYEQALKEKECFTYKLGKALITANSVRGGGGEYLLISNSFKKCVG